MKKLIFPILLLSPALALANSDLNYYFGQINDFFSSIIFFNILFFTSYKLPFAVFCLLLGSIYFTISFNFLNISYFKHAIDLVRGKFDSENSNGEVSHFAALTTALSGTLGLGNISGIAVAISLGGPGATFWIIFAGFIGMTAKFVECTLAMIYRQSRGDGHIMGGPMEYLNRGLTEQGLPRLGKFLSVIFSFLCIGGALGGGTSFQVNQSITAIAETFPLLNTHPWIYGLIMSALTGFVIIGGIQRIAKVSEKIVPFMCGIYIFSCLYILTIHFREIPNALFLIFKSAFTSEAQYGGLMGVFVTGFKRAAFSNEAGIGSAAIAHSVAKSAHPIQEGLVSLLEPFIDTVLMCTITALLFIVTSAHSNPIYESLRINQNGAALTSRVMAETIPWFPPILSVIVFMFAFATIISWSFYGERCFSYLFGEKFSIIYKILIVVVVFLGSITSATHIIEFGDLMILGMAFPNLIGCFLLKDKVHNALSEYKNLILKSSK